MRRLPENKKLRIYHLENKPTRVRELSTRIELEIVTTKDLEGHSCWTIDLTTAEPVFERSLARWGSAVIEVEIEESFLQTSNL
ncbi:MAG: hypothetical protein ACOX4A_05195 [Saccharofermentanales bacterium]